MDGLLGVGGALRFAVLTVELGLDPRVRLAQRLTLSEELHRHPREPGRTKAEAHRGRVAVHRDGGNPVAALSGKRSGWKGGRTAAGESFQATTWPFKMGTPAGTERTGSFSRYCP